MKYSYEKLQFLAYTIYFLKWGRHWSLSITTHNCVSFPSPPSCKYVVNMPILWYQKHLAFWIMIHSTFRASCVMLHQDECVHPSLSTSASLVAVQRLCPSCYKLACVPYATMHSNYLSGKICKEYAYLLQIRKLSYSWIISLTWGMKRLY